MRTTARKILIGLCLAPIALGLPALAQQMPKSTTEQLKGTPSVKTEQLAGTVIFSEGNRLVLRMSTGDLRTFEVPEGRTALVDGKNVTVDELKPGTKLAATVTVTTTPITERTTTVGSGKVWFVAGNNVILTLPNGENRMYKVKDSYKFTVEGQEATVRDLRKGMVIAAQKIVEEPRTEVGSNTVVTGHAPPPPPVRKTEVARTLSPPKPVPVAAPAPTPTPTPAPVAAPAVGAEPAPVELPKTGSPLPLFGLAGLLMMCASLALHLRDS